MKTAKLITNLQLIVLCIILLACMKNDFEFDKLKTDNLNAEWGVPLVSSKLTLEDFLNDTSGTINVNPDGLISLIYESEQLFSVQAQDRTHIPDQGNEEKEFFPVILPPNTTGDTLEVYYYLLYFLISHSN